MHRCLLFRKILEPCLVVLSCYKLSFIQGWSIAESLQGPSPRHFSPSSFYLDFNSWSKSHVGGQGRNLQFWHSFIHLRKCCLVLNLCGSCWQSVWWSHLLLFGRRFGNFVPSISKVSHSSRSFPVFARSKTLWGSSNSVNDKAYSTLDISILCIKTTRRPHTFKQSFALLSLDRPKHLNTN